MDEYIAIFTAWPYANGDLHLGHVAGVYLPADIFARYHRLRGDHVLMVSGSDTHGTPVAVEAGRLGISPREVSQRYHHRYLRDWQRLGIGFDLFTHTDTAHHRAIASEIFARLYTNGAIVPGNSIQAFCEADNRFLPDRYVEGTCPHCGFSSARGDQCDNCGRLLDAAELVQPRCHLCGATPGFRESSQLFFDLPAFQDRLVRYLTRQEHWRANVRAFALNFVDSGLQQRAATRDLDWGIPVPVDGLRDKAIYVWIEAVMGYLTASMEWASQQGDENAWCRWWEEDDARSYYFIGKDNIPFHAIIWPAELMGYNSALNLPYDIPANEFLTLEGRQFSTSRHWAVWLADVLDRYDPDALRYYLTAIAPETADTDFTWQGFVDRNNNELVAAWGNLVQRVVTFAIKNWQGEVPTPGPLRPVDVALLEEIDRGFEAVGALYAETRFKAALRKAMELARTVNRYLEECGPWFEIKSDRESAGTTIYTALRAIDSLALLLAPVLPYSSERVRHVLGHDRPLFGSIELDGDVLTYRPTEGERDAARWQPSQLRSGQVLRPPERLFSKLDDKVVGEERDRLRAV